MALQSEMSNEKKHLKTYCTFLNNCIDYLAQRTVIEQLSVSYFRTEPCFTLSKLFGDDISDFAQSVEKFTFNINRWWIGDVHVRGLQICVSSKLSQ